tara:strand:+ start:785 stop:1870 length:1086 start_codon:yes stop_codon:yes gene_type:complete
MTEATLIPASDQVQLMLDSPMTDSEHQQLASVEARGARADQRIVNSKLERALCLIQVYQDKLFRGKAGGRTWGDYLQSIDLAKLGYTEGLSTEAASNEMMFGLLCEAIDDWNDANPTRPELPKPRGRSYMDGWATLFDRTRKAGTGTYSPFGDCSKALETWKTAVFKNNGEAPLRAPCNAIGRKARDAGLGRSLLGGAGNNQHLEAGRAGFQFQPQPESVLRTVSAQTRMEAASAQLERDQRHAEDRPLCADGIDPRSISTMEKDSDFDVMNECETYSTQMNKVHLDIQTLEAWVRGRLNQYGTDGMNMLRQFDAGLYTIKDDVGTITHMGQRLIELADLLQDHVEPGSLVDGKYQSEPTA